MQFNSYLAQAIARNRRSPLGLGLVITLASCVVAGSALCEPEIRIREYQEMLIWTGDYDGMVDGQLGAGTTQAIRKFQVRIGHSPTGTLGPQELLRLRREGAAQKQKVGFSQVKDKNAGVSVGIPQTIVSRQMKKSWGSNWSAQDDRVNIDT
jgi:peptidoglycan hydrolase-like protein with peptidoglycan-binding domain